MSEVTFTHRAREDLFSIWVHIAFENPSAADRAYDRIDACCRQLRDFPKLGPSRSDIAADARMLVIDRLLALYRLVNDGAQVVRIVDGARDLSLLDWPRRP